MLQAFVSGVRIGRRGLTRPQVALLKRRQSDATLIAPHRTLREDQRDVFDSSASKHYTLLPDLSETCLPFYSQSYTCEASTSKAVPPTPPTLVVPTDTTETPKHVKQLKRLRRVLRLFQRTLQGLRKSHLSSLEQIKVLEPLFAKLSAELCDFPGHISTDALPPQLYNALESISSWMMERLGESPTLGFNDALRNIAVNHLRIQHFFHITFPNRFSQDTQNIRCKSVILALSYLSHASSLASSSDYNKNVPREVLLPVAITFFKACIRQERRRNDRLRLLSWCRHYISLLELSIFMLALPPDDWLHLPADIVDDFANAILKDNTVAEHLSTCLPKTSKNSKLPGSKSKIHQLHRYMAGLQFNPPSLVPSMFGPPPHRRPLFEGLKYIISSSINSLDIFREKLPTADIIVSLVHLYRKYHLPPDRQVMAAILHFASLTDGDMIQSLVAADVFAWLWREWTVLRENEPFKAADDILLLGFLGASPKFGRPDSICEGMAENAQHRNLPVPVWSSQAFELALADVGVPLGKNVSSIRHSFEQDLPEHVHYGIIRAIALSAIHLRRWDLAFAYALDDRLPSKHIPSILEELSRTVISFRKTDVSLSRSLAQACAQYLTQLSDRVPRSLAPNHAAQLSAFIEMMLEEGYTSAALAFIFVPRTPLQLGWKACLQILHLLSNNGQDDALTQVFNRIQLEEWPTEHLRFFLAGRDAAISDSIWKVFREKPENLTHLFLEARLLHHLRRPQFSYKGALNDYKLGKKNVTGAPAPDTLIRLLDVHLRARCGHTALQLYRQLESLRDKPKGLALRYLRIAVTPKWQRYRHSGPRSQLAKLNHSLDQLVLGGNKITPQMANFLLCNSLTWMEMDEEAIWAIINSTNVKNSDDVDKVNGKAVAWRRDIQPLYASVIRAFRKRGNEEAAARAETLMMESRRRTAKCEE